jgi:hypothetical protein
MVEIPEERRGDGPCQNCEQEYFDWSADNAFWNNVIAEWKGVDWTGGDPGAILCITCFGVIAHNLGYDMIGFRMTPEWRWQRRL